MVHFHEKGKKQKKMMFTLIKTAMRSIVLKV
jgi:hypothetical protein